MEPTAPPVGRDGLELYGGRCLIIALIGTLVKSTAHSATVHDLSAVVHWGWHHYLGWPIFLMFAVIMMMRWFGVKDAGQQVFGFYGRVLTAPFVGFSDETRAANRDSRSFRRQLHRTSFKEDEEQRLLDLEIRAESRRATAEVAAARAAAAAAAAQTQPSVDLGATPPADTAGNTVEMPVAHDAVAAHPAAPARFPSQTVSPGDSDAGAR